jgi:hypothetical protein
VEAGEIAEAREIEREATKFTETISHRAHGEQSHTDVGRAGADERKARFTGALCESLFSVGSV